jgi:hypothetical protein
MSKKKNLKVVSKKIDKSKSFYRLSDGSWISIATAWVTKPRKGKICGKGTEEAIPYLAKLVKKEISKRNYQSVEPYPAAIIGEEKHLFATKIVNEVVAIMKRKR